MSNINFWSVHYVAFKEYRIHGPGHKGFTVHYDHLFGGLAVSQCSNLTLVVGHTALDAFKQSCGNLLIWPENLAFVASQITHRDTLSNVTELTGAAITTRGQYNRPGTLVPPGERKLYLLIEGSSESSIKKAKTELKKILAETQDKVLRRDPPGKYSVM